MNQLKSNLKNEHNQLTSPTLIKLVNLWIADKTTFFVINKEGGFFV